MFLLMKMRRHLALMGVLISFLGVIVVFASSPVVQPGKQVPIVSTETILWNYCIENHTVTLPEGGLLDHGSIILGWQMDSHYNAELYVSFTFSDYPFNIYFFNPGDVQDYTIAENAVPVLEITNLTAGTHRYSLPSRPYTIAAESSDEEHPATVENFIVCEAAETQVTNIETEYDYLGMNAGAVIVIFGVITLVAGLAVKPRKQST
jgi:hypothetical protein